MRIGLLGGTFDPIHIGHLHQAQQMLQNHHLDEIWFIPARVNPFKQDAPPAPSHHRLEMIELAIRDEPRFKVLDLELKREGPSYTIDTVRELQSIHPYEFYLIISDDMVPTLPKWRRIGELMQMFPILVGQRREPQSSPPTTGDARIDEVVKKGFTLMPLVRVQATEIRKSLRQSLPVREVLPPGVLSYIIEHQLYRD